MENKPNDAQVLKRNTSGDNVSAANRLLPVANLNPTHSPLETQLVLSLLADCMQFTFLGES